MAAIRRCEVSKVIWSGESIEVREIRKRNGNTAYGLGRPYSAGILEEFEGRDFAVLMAIDIEAHGGSYDAKSRKRARKFAKETLPVYENINAELDNLMNRFGRG
jgi:hypothetical protein